MDPLRVVERRVRMMQIVEYTEAVDLTMHGMHDDIYVMQPMAISAGTVWNYFNKDKEAEE